MEGASQECLLHSCSSDPDLQQLELSSEATDDHHIESKATPVLPSPLDAQQSLFHTQQRSPFHAQQSPFHSHAHRRTGSGGSFLYGLCMVEGLVVQAAQTAGINWLRQVQQSGKEAQEEKERWKWLFSRRHPKITLPQQLSFWYRAPHAK